MPSPRYVELETVRRAVNIRDGGDAVDDDLLWSAILAAEQQIDNWCGRVFTLDDTVSTRTYRSTGFEYLFVGDIGDPTGLIVETGGIAGEWSTLTADCDFYLEAGYAGWPTSTLVSASRWPDPVARRTIRVTAKWGWPEVPASVAHAAQIQSIRLFKRKDSPEGVAGWDQVGAVRVTRLDPDVVELLKPYMRQTSIA